MSQYCYSNACSIDIGQSVVITGGRYTKRKVTEYREDGQTKELPQLITGRQNHGCSSYVDNDYNNVKATLPHLIFIKLFGLGFVGNCWL